MHLLDGHVGKGQQFDNVIIVGLEEAILPHYGAMVSADPAALTAELAVLQVMVSRAKEDLVVTTCNVVPNQSGREYQREPSRWLSLVADVADQDVDLR